MKVLKLTPLPRVSLLVIPKVNYACSSLKCSQPRTSPDSVPLEESSPVPSEQAWRSEFKVVNTSQERNSTPTPRVFKELFLWWAEKRNLSPMFPVVTPALWLVWTTASWSKLLLLELICWMHIISGWWNTLYLQLLGLLLLLVIHLIFQSSLMDLTSYPNPIP